MKNLTNLFATLLLLSFSFNLYATDIKVSIDRSYIELNETFTLTFSANGDPDGDPDFSPLEKDFNILSQSSSSNISIINGQYTRSKKWNVSLLALHKGTIIIPPIHFGSDLSSSYQVIIRQPKASTGKRGESFMSELEINTNTVYTQAQILVTQRLLSSSNIKAFEFSPLKTKGVEIIQEKLGEAKQYQVTRGKTPYLVLEQHYAIYPQSTGTLIFEPSIASARVTIQNSRRSRSAFDPFSNNTKTLRRSSKRKQVKVKPVPKSFKGKHWLAAKEVQLVEEFPDSDSLKVGEPITRTLVLLVDGQLSSQLPEFSTPDVKNLKQYPDKPLLKNNVSDSGITGVQQVKVAIIPAVAGNYTLPAISIPWWNTQTDTLEYATIKPRSFSVKNTHSENTKSVTPPVKSNSTLDETSNSLTTTQPDTISVTKEDSPNDSLLWKILSFILGVSLLITLFLLWRQKSTPPLIDTDAHEKTASVNRALKIIKQSCDNSDASATKNALLQWAAAIFVDENIHSLGNITTRVDKTLAEKIESLNSYLYQNNKADKMQWKCDELFELCVKFTDSFKRETKRDAQKQNNLESLYK